MLEYSIYSVISPEGCASILWRDPARVSDASAQLKLTAQDLVQLGICDEIIPEAAGGAHREPAVTASNVRTALKRHSASWPCCPPRAGRAPLPEVPRDGRLSRTPS
jgi:acetyl-CoA carboxylase carboxyl transferase subunit alpha